MPVCLCPSILSMFSREGLWGVGGLYGHSSWARRPHIMRWVPQAQRPPNTMGSAQEDGVLPLVRAGKIANAAMEEYHADTSRWERFSEDGHPGSRVCVEAMR